MKKSFVVLKNGFAFEFELALNCKVHLAIDKYEDVILDEQSTTDFNIENLAESADQMVKTMFPRAFGRLITMRDQLNLDDLVVTYSPKMEYSLDRMYQYLEDGAATIVAFGVEEDITPDNIRKWVRGTIDFDEGNDEPDSEEIFNDKKMLNAIYEAAEPLAEFIRGVKFVKGH